MQGLHIAEGILSSNYNEKGKETIQMAMLKMYHCKCSNSEINLWAKVSTPIKEKPL